MEPTNNRPPIRKKKRRLKKNVRIGLMVIGALACILLVWGITRLFSGGQETSLESQKTTQTAETDSSSTSAEDESESSTNSKTGLTTYPDNGEEKITVMLDAGHGGLDPGNVMTDALTGEQYLEKDINLKLVKLVARKLEATNPNLDVILVRSSDNIDYTTEEDDLNWRTEIQSEVNGTDTADYFISIHANANAWDSTIYGYNFFVKPKDTVMQDMAALMAEKLEAQDWSKNNGTITDQALQVVSFSPTHAMLIEVGYMTNDEELTNLLDNKNLDKIANAIAAGISDYIMENPDSVNIESPAMTFKELNPNAEVKGHANEEGDDSEDSSSESSVTDGYNGTIGSPGTSDPYDPYGLNASGTEDSTAQESVTYDMYGYPIQ